MRREGGGTLIYTSKISVFLKIFSGVCWNKGRGGGLIFLGNDTFAKSDKNSISMKLWPVMPRVRAWQNNKQ